MPNMTEPSPRPCHHTLLAMAIVLLAGLSLGAFSPPPGPAVEGQGGIHATTKIAHGR